MQDFTWSLMTQTQRQAALSRPAAISDHALITDVREQRISQRKDIRWFQTIIPRKQHLS